MSRPKKCQVLPITAPFRSAPYASNQRLNGATKPCMARRKGQDYVRAAPQGLASTALPGRELNCRHHVRRNCRFGRMRWRSPTSRQAPNTARVAPKKPLSFVRFRGSPRAQEMRNERERTVVGAVRLAKGLAKRSAFSPPGRSTRLRLISHHRRISRAGERIFAARGRGCNSDRRFRSSQQCPH